MSTNPVCLLGSIGRPAFSFGRVQKVSKCVAVLRTLSGIIISEMINISLTRNRVPLFSSEIGLSTQSWLSVNPDRFVFTTPGGVVARYWVFNRSPGA